MAICQLPCRHSLSPVAHLRCGRRLRAGDGLTLCRRWRGVGVRTARRRLPLLAIAGPARRTLRSFCPRDGDVGLRCALDDPVEAGRHPLRVVAAVVALTAVILVGRVLLRLSPLPGLRSTCLQRLTLEILLLFLFLFKVLCGLLLFRGLTPLVTIDFILLYWRLRGSSVDRSLHKQR